MRFTTIFSAITVLAPAMVQAQTQANNDIWSGNIGMSTAVMPTYMGSNRYIVRAFPILSLEYKNRAYLGGSVATHVRADNPLFTHVLFGVYVGIVVWAGIYLRDAALTELLPIRKS